MVWGAFVRDALLLIQILQDRIERRVIDAPSIQDNLIMIVLVRYYFAFLFDGDGFGIPKSAGGRR